MRGQTPVPFSASAGGGGFVAKRGGCVSSHHSPQGGCRTVGDGDWEVLIIKLYIKH